MSQTLRGEVAVKSSKQGKSKKPPYKAYTLWSLKLALDDGKESDWIDAGFEQPPVEKGDYVEVLAEANARGYLGLQSICKVDRPTRPAAAAAAAESAEGGFDRQSQIVWQHSQDVAIAEVALLLEHDALPLSKAESKAGQQKRYDEITAAIAKKTVQRFIDVGTGRLLETVSDEGDVSVEPDGQIPAAGNSTATDKAEDGE